jgi:hypothetical protein
MVIITDYRSRSGRFTAEIPAERHGDVVTAGAEIAGIFDPRTGVVTVTVGASRRFHLGPLALVLAAAHADETEAQNGA